MPLPAKEALVSTEGKLRQGSACQAWCDLGLSEIRKTGNLSLAPVTVNKGSFYIR